MTELEFSKGIALLKNYYIDWSFDVHNTMMLKVWYKGFKDMGYKAFQDVLMNYMESSSYAPRSPMDIKNSIPKVSSVAEAWSIITDTYKRSSNQSYMMNTLYKEHQELYQFVKDMNFYEYETDSYGNSCKGYHLKQLGYAFRIQYQEYLDSIKIKYVGNQLTYSKNTKLLGGTI